MEDQRMQMGSPGQNATSKNSYSDGNSPTSTKYTNMSPPPRPRQSSDFNNGSFNPNYHTLHCWPQQPQYPPPLHQQTNQQLQQLQQFQFQPQPQLQPPVQPKHKPEEENLISEAEQERLYQLAKKLAKERTEKWVESLFELCPNV
ncbi:hypothetical protein IFR05_006387 [Cadophora sp. M221]|nr:hypothetical protein IFR05_006387 [Cadophora sp. M221]